MKIRKNRTKAVILFMISLLSMLNCFFKSTKTYANDSKSSTYNNIIPKPLTYEEKEGKFTVNNNTVLYVKGKNESEIAEISKIADYINEKLSVPTGFKLKVDKNSTVKDNGIVLTTDGGKESQGNEGYSLVSNDKNIIITSYKPEGIFRGIQTFIQMLPVDIEKSSLVNNIEWSIPAVFITDKPKYGYRGFMIDVARNFFDINEIKRQIDFASQYKINKLHLHLSDDQGWRLEIKKYPELTQVGGSTKVGGGKGGYYTQEQFKDLVNYAKTRYMDIVPEFDMPGHSNAALASYDFLNPDNKKKPLYTGIDVGFSSFMTDSEKTYEFIDDVFKEVSEISPSKYIHIGGDEALSTKKEDYDYFVGRVAKLAQKYGKTPIGWDPIDTSPSIDSSVVLENWKDSNDAARAKNMKMIIAIAGKAYLDMKYNEDTPYGLDWAGFIPIETAYKWDPQDYAPEQLILGIEAPLWTETIADEKQMDYMIYPRLLGYAEIGWTPKELRSWDEYKVRLKNQKERFVNKGINFYDDSSVF